MKLTAAIVRGLRSPGKYTDGRGLFLHVVDADKRYWMFRYQRDGRERVMSLGGADLVALADARRLHTEARALLAKGIDPLDAREAAKPKPTHTFAEVMEQCIAAHAAGWRGARSIPAWRHSLVAYALPVFGAKLVGEIDLDDVLKVLQPIWITKAVTAARVRNRIETVLDYAKARGWRSGENPAVWCGNLKMLLPARAKFHVVEHRAALPWRDAPAFMVRLAHETSMAGRCLAFCILTGTRSAEARGAQWDEIELDQQVWTIPASRTKAARQQRVPLSAPAMEIVRSLAAVRTTEPFVFFGQRAGRPLSDHVLLRVLRRLGHGDMTVHGFRSTFRDWCGDTGKSWEAAEMALAHAPSGKVVAAYARSDLLDQRRTLMSEWADFLTHEPAQVVPLRAAR
jgi:integrase